MYVCVCVFGGGGGGLGGMQIEQVLDFLVPVIEGNVCCVSHWVAVCSVLSSSCVNDSANGVSACVRACVCVCVCGWVGGWVRACYCPL